MTSVALRVDPHAEVEAIHLIGQRDAGVTVPFDVVQEPAETLLPLVGVRAPRPVLQVLKPVFAVGLKSVFRVVDALPVDPLTELIAIDGVRPQDAGVPATSKQSGQPLTKHIIVAVTPAATAPALTPLRGRSPGLSRREQQDQTKLSWLLRASQGWRSTPSGGRLSAEQRRRTHGNRRDGDRGRWRHRVGDGANPGGAGLGERNCGDFVVSARGVGVIDPPVATIWAVSVMRPMSVCQQDRYDSEPRPPSMHK